MSMSKKYWRGLSELNESPEFLKQHQSEFAEPLPIDEFLNGEEEKSGAPAVDAVGKPVEIDLHAELGEADIGAVKIGDDVDHEDERHDAPGDLAPDRRGKNAGVDRHQTFLRKRGCGERADHEAYHILSAAKCEENEE